MTRNPPPVGTIVSGGEPKLTVRIIGRCTFQCPSCCTESSPERPGILRIEDFATIVDRLARADYTGVVNLSGGEPTLHPQLEEMLALLGERLPHAPVVSFTNGSWIGGESWQEKLRRLVSFPNVLIRLSVDRQHTVGALNVAKRTDPGAIYKDVEALLFRRAALFLRECAAMGARPGHDYDVAYKGSVEIAGRYLSDLGAVPVYPIRFHKDPVNRPKNPGYFAIDIDSEGRPFVFPTLGHVLGWEPLGGLERLGEALEMNRCYLKDENKAWT